MKTNLILFDLHNRIETHQRIIDTVKADAVYHIGDYWDDFNDTPRDAQETARWVLERQIAGDNMLLGNHDVYYLYGNAKTMCSGNDYAKLSAVRSILTTEWQRNQFRLFYWLHTPAREILLTHAGLAPRWIGRPNRPKIVPTITKRLEAAEASLKMGGTPGIACDVEFSRGGWSNLGGCLWQDWRWFVPIPWVSQIVGHTPAPAPRVIRYLGGEAHCGDTHSEHFATVAEDGTIEMHSTLGALDKPHVDMVE